MIFKITRIIFLIFMHKENKLILLMLEKANDLNKINVKTKII